MLFGDTSPVSPPASAASNSTMAPAYAFYQAQFWLVFWESFAVKSVSFASNLVLGLVILAAVVLCVSAAHSHEFLAAASRRCVHRRTLTASSSSADHVHCRADPEEGTAALARGAHNDDVHN